MTEHEEINTQLEALRAALEALRAALEAAHVYIETGRVAQGYAALLHAQEHLDAVRKLTA